MAKPKPNKVDYNVFLSWSGMRSKQVALEFRRWLKPVLQVADAWMSDVDIDKGSVGLSEISKALETCRVGVVFLTADTLKEPWVNFEAGALAKTVREEARLFTFLLDGLRPSDVTGPLQQFQHTRPAAEDVKKMVLDMARALDSDLPPDALGDAFDGQWPRFERALKSLPQAPKNVQHRQDRELLEEILGIVRGVALAQTRNDGFHALSVNDILDDTLMALREGRPSREFSEELDRWKAASRAKGFSPRIVNAAVAQFLRENPPAASKPSREGQ